MVGAGVVGLAVAEELARSGREVLVLERDRVGETCAASVAAGMLAPAAEADATPHTTTVLALWSHGMYPEWVARLEATSGIDMEFDRSGTVVAALDADDLRELVHLERAQRRFGSESRRLSAEEARELQPSLGPGVVGGLLLSGDWQVNPRRLLQALRRSLELEGGRVFEGAAVQALERRDGAWRLVVQGSRTLKATTVVLAAGAWTASLVPPDLPKPPVRPVRGAALRLGGGLATPVVVRTPRVYVVPRASGETVVGAKESRRALPCVDEMPLREVGVGFRPAIRDGVPAMGPLDGDRTLFVATGHYRKGIELAPLTAALVRALVEGREHPLAASVDPRRFGAQGEP